MNIIVTFHTINLKEKLTLEPYSQRSMSAFTYLIDTTQIILTRCTHAVYSLALCITIEAN